MPSEHASAELLGALSRLLSTINATDISLEVDGVAAARATLAEVADQLSDYVIPRLVQLEAPLLTVVGGSTGAGKSTLVNSVVGEKVTESGVLRPTTRSPVLVHNPADAKWFQPDRILPDLPRTETDTNDVYALRLAASEHIPPGLAILDAPDVDSVDADNRELAGQLLAAADLWLFVTSAARYADQVPWQYLRRAVERGTSVAVVLDRTQEDSLVEVRGHLARMMTSRGLSDSPLFSVPESHVDSMGLLPAESVAPISGWLRDLAADAEGRASVVFSTLDGTVRHNIMRSHDIVDHLEAQVVAGQELYGLADATYANAEITLSEHAGDGTLLRGDVLTRWHDLASSGELVRAAHGRVTRLRNRLVDNVVGRRSRAEEVEQAIGAGLRALVLEHGESAAEQIFRAWSASSAGRHLLQDNPGLERVAESAAEAADRLVRDWQAETIQLVQVPHESGLSMDQGRGAAAALSVLVLANSVVDEATEERGGPTYVARKFLESVVGPEAVRESVAAAGERLKASIRAFLANERARYVAVVKDPAEREAAQNELREATRQAEYARHADFFDEGSEGL